MTRKILVTLTEKEVEILKQLPIGNASLAGRIAFLVRANLQEFIKN